MARQLTLLIIVNAAAVLSQNDNNMNTTLPISSSVTNVPQTTWTTQYISTSETANNNLLCTVDTSPNPDNSCLDFYRWNLCGEDWIKGKCCLTCGYKSCLDICYNNDVSNVPSEYYPNPFDCTSNIPPPPGPDGSQPSCKDQASWDNCGQGWMYGFCCSSCPNDCGCDANNTGIIDTDTDTEPVVTVFYNYTGSQNNCNRDIPPPPGPDGKIPECIDQYRWGNCDQSWMDSYCCLTCGYVSCLDTCWDGEVENIPSEYYPSPFDCESNGFLETEDDSCIDEAKWNNCGQSWMFGLCCVSCPEACNCQNYSWGNNTAYINSRPAVIVTLSFEAIQNWERIFITLHSLLLFAILIIPFMLCYKLWFERMTATILQKMTSFTEPEETTENRNDPESVTSTKGHKKAVGSLESLGSMPTTDGCKGSTSGPVSSDDDHELSSRTHGDTLRTRSIFRSGTRSRSRKSTTNDGSSTKNKIYAFYKILAIICIGLWTLSIICQIISLALWHHDDYTDNLIESISKEWDTFRMLMYVIAKMLMYASFICRIHFSFQTSAYSYSIYFIVFLFVILLIDTIVKILCYQTQINDLSGNMIDRDFIKYDGNDTLLFYGLIFLIVEEVIYTIILIFAFIKPLFMMSINAERLSKGVLSVITKYVILGIWCIVSSAIISIIRLFYLSTTNILIIWFTALFESFDCAINTWCTILLFTVANSWYKKVCKYCIKCIQSVCIKEFKADGIELEQY